MTYKEVVDKLLEAMNNHLLIQTTGYGNLSDIHVPETEDAPDYPYMFLNPLSSQMNERNHTFTFNLICMEQVLEGQTYDLEGQSDCGMWIQDVVSYFRMQNNNPLLDIQFPIQLTPFKERFEDDVVGMTAQITVTFANPLDLCDAAYE